MDPGHRRTALVTPDYLGRPVRLNAFTGVMLAPSRVGDPTSARAFARPYRDVAARLMAWAAEGSVLHDSAPALYLHEYTVRGLTAQGLVGLLDLRHRAAPGDPVGVLPHEDVHPEQVLDLADRMDEMSMNPAPILLAHHATPRLRELLAQRAARTPDWAYTDRQNNRQRIWALRSPEDQSLVQQELADTRLLIADGHHRYSAYLELARRHPGTGHELGLAMLVDQDTTPLFLGAIHRVLHPARLRMVADAARTLGATPTAITDRDTALQGLAERHIVLTDGTEWLGITVPDAEDLATIQWVHQYLLPALSPAPEIEHHHSVDTALDSLTDRDGAVALLLPAPDLATIERVAAAGQVLAEKATSFQPKPSLGVLMRMVE